MKDRKPYELKGIIQLYNISQVAISAYIVYVIGAYGWFSHYDWMCQPVEMDPDPSSFAMKIGKVIQKSYFSKNLILPKVEFLPFKIDQNKILPFQDSFE